ncbi:uncharacterized protein [Dermacentor albipictus]|uniref:uncharacterized protein n=1 Tax=Dermacentor albipictus TaxID=60249 RepID=UPI0031FCF128
MAKVAPPKRKRGPKYCCVVGCHNSADNTKERADPVKLYRFPGRSYEKERRQAWITAVRRINPDGTSWLPKEHTRICSTHFVGNCKSDIKQHPSYIPSIFPPVYRKKAPDRNRAQRWQTRFDRAVTSRKRHAGDEDPSQSTADGATTMQDSETSILDDVPPITDFSDASVETCSASHSHNGIADSDSLVHDAAEESNCARKKDATCQTEEFTTPARLSILLSATNGTEASTQVVHTEMSHKVASTDGNWKRDWISGL